jgi:hypothetical protein
VCMTALLRSCPFGACATERSTSVQPATTAGVVQLLTRSSYWSQPSHHRHYSIGGSTIYRRKRMAPSFGTTTHKCLQVHCLFSRRQYSTLNPLCCHERGLAWHSGNYSSEDLTHSVSYRRNPIFTIRIFKMLSKACCNMYFCEAPKITHETRPTALSWEQ